MVYERVEIQISRSLLRINLFSYICYSCLNISRRNLEGYFRTSYLNINCRKRKITWISAGFDGQVNNVGTKCGCSNNQGPYIEWGLDQDQISHSHNNGFSLMIHAFIRSRQIGHHSLSYYSVNLYKLSFRARLGTTLRFC